MSEGKYIYCITGANEQRTFGPIGIGSRGDEVHMVCYDDIAAVVSNSPVIKYPIVRENMIAHQKVMEEVMKYYTVLPVRFSTIAEGKGGLSPEKRIKEQVLKTRHHEFKDLLREMEGKVEIGVKALWTDMNVIFKEIVERNREIRMLKRKLAPKNPLKIRDEKVKLGEMVKSALDGKRSREGKEILNPLKKISYDFRTNKTFGDKMIINAAFLVDVSQEKEFDNRIKKLRAKYNGRIVFKYVGPVPIWNFVEIVISWDE